MSWNHLFSQIIIVYFRSKNNNNTCLFSRKSACGFFFYQFNFILVNIPVNSPGGTWNAFLFILKILTGSPGFGVLLCCPCVLRVSERLSGQKCTPLLLSCPSVSSGESPLSSDSSACSPTSPPVSSLCGHPALCCPHYHRLGLKMVIKVYIASSTGSVAVSVCKMLCWLLHTNKLCSQVTDAWNVPERCWLLLCKWIGECTWRGFPSSESHQRRSDLQAGYYQGSTSITCREYVWFSHLSYIQVKQTSHEWWIPFLLWGGHSCHT